MLVLVLVLLLPCIIGVTCRNSSFWIRMDCCSSRTFRSMSGILSATCNQRPAFTPGLLVSACAMVSTSLIHFWSSQHLGILQGTVDAKYMRPSLQGAHQVCRAATFQQPRCMNIMCWEAKGAHAVMCREALSAKGGTGHSLPCLKDHDSIILPCAGSMRREDLGMPEGPESLCMTACSRDGSVMEVLPIPENDWCVLAAVQGALRRDRLTAPLSWAEHGRLRHWTGNAKQGERTTGTPQIVIIMFHHGKAAVSQNLQMITEKQHVPPQRTCFCNSV